MKKVVERYKEMIKNATNDQIKEQLSRQTKTLDTLTKNARLIAEREVQEAIGAANYSKKYQLMLLKEKFFTGEAYKDNDVKTILVFHEMMHQALESRNLALMVEEINAWRLTMEVYAEYRKQTGKEIEAFKDYYTAYLNSEEAFRDYVKEVYEKAAQNKKTTLKRTEYEFSEIPIAFRCQAHRTR